MEPEPDPQVTMEPDPNITQVLNQEIAGQMQATVEDLTKGIPDANLAPIGIDWTVQTLARLMTTFMNTQPAPLAPPVHCTLNARMKAKIKDSQHEFPPLYLDPHMPNDLIRVLLSDGRWLEINPVAGVVSVV